MDAQQAMDSGGPFEARYLAFLETITQLRPRLHRYCSRMTGSVMDGEDVVQEALFHAYRKLDTFDDQRPLSPWLFRIAHNRCIDFLRRRGVREEAETFSVESDAVVPVEPVGPAVSQALEYLVSSLPPKERACVLLKDVFDYSLEEIAELVDSTVGGVKAALNRGRSKLESLSDRRIVPPPATAEASSLVRRYVDGFNRRDWDELRKLIGADARLRVADRFAGRLTDSPYFARYERQPIPWRMALGQLDGEAVILSLQKGPAGWEPKAVIRLHVVEHLAEQRIAGITDYSHCPWVLAAAASVTLSE